MGDTSTDWAAELAFAEILAAAARRIALRHFRRPLEVEWKADESPVTIADREIETELRRLIRDRFPGHGILGEEFAAQPGDGCIWVSDPIDGTRASFVESRCSNPDRAVARRNTVLGVIDVPALDERWLVAQGDPVQRDPRCARAGADQRRRASTRPHRMPDSGGAWRYDALSRAPPYADLVATVTIRAARIRSLRAGHRGRPAAVRLPRAGARDRGRGRANQRLEWPAPRPGLGWVGSRRGESTLWKQTLEDLR